MIEDERPSYAKEVRDFNDDVEETEEINDNEEKIESPSNSAKANSEIEMTNEAKMMILDTVTSFAGGLMAMLKRVPEHKQEEFMRKYKALTIPMLQLIDFASVVDLSFLDTKWKKLGGGVLVMFGSSFMVHLDEDKVDNSKNSSPYTPPQKPPVQDNITNNMKTQPEEQKDIGKVGEK